MLADCFEATLGALFLDRQPLGLAAVKSFTAAVLFPITQVRC
jgi:dsRNA-specific ribonuclease